MKTCEHINHHNKRDCEEEVVAACICCNVGVCSEHATYRCQFGGERFEDLE